MNLTEKHIRALLVSYTADSLARLGFRTETRKLKIQAETTIKLIAKALDEMPKLDPWDSVSAVLSGQMAPAHRISRQKRGQHFQRIGDAEKVMLKTLRGALDSLYKTQATWSKREQLQATSRMMKAFSESPKEKAKALVAAMPKENGSLSHRREKL